MTLFPCDSHGYLSTVTKYVATVKISAENVHYVTMGSVELPAILFADSKTTFTPVMSNCQ